jgi:hypothetical protein
VTECDGHGRSWSLVANTASSGQRSRFWCPTAQAPGGSRRSQLPKCRWQTTRRMSLGWSDFARTQLRALGHPRSSSYGITAGVRRLGHQHCASVFIAA